MTNREGLDRTTPREETADLAAVRVRCETVAMAGRGRQERERDGSEAVVSKGVASRARSSPSDPCVFCEIVAGRSPAAIVFADDEVVAFLDRVPLFHGHVLVVPRRHVVTLADLPVESVGPFFERVRHLSARLPEEMGASGTFVANNNVVSQSVPHLHQHVVPRTRGDGLRGFFWPRTRYAEGEAEALAARLRPAFESTWSAADAIGVDRDASVPGEG